MHIVSFVLGFFVLSAISVGASAAPGLRSADQGSPTMVSSGYALEYLSGVLLVLLALGGLAYFLRRFQGRLGAAQGELRVQGSLSLGGKERLVVVNVQGENLLLGVSPGGVNLVQKLSISESDTGATGTTSNWLSRTLNNARNTNKSSGDVST